MRFRVCTTGICMQVAQENDTNCLGEIAGSLLGAYFSPGNVEARWLAPFNEGLRTTVAGYYSP